MTVPEAAATVEAMADIGIPFAIRTLATLRAADIIAAAPGGRMSADDLAHVVGASPTRLEVLLRTLDGASLLDRDEAGFALTELGQVLLSDHPADLRARLDLDTALGRADLAFAGLRDCLVEGRPAFEMVFGIDYWEALRADEGLARSFHREMAKNANWVAPRLLELLDLQQDVTVIDVGGGTGALLTQLAKARPGVSGTVVDLTLTEPYAEELLTKSGVCDQVRFEAGDFFVSVPSGGGLYLVSMVIHDWPDAEAVALLTQCRRSMDSGSQLVLIEIGPGTHDSPLDEAMVDLHLIACAGARLRSGEELASLLETVGFARVEALATGGDLEIWSGWVD